MVFKWEMEQNALVASDSMSDDAEEGFFCHRCGHPLPSGARFCQKCGARQPDRRRLQRGSCPCSSCICCCSTCCVLVLLCLAISTALGISALQNWLGSCAGSVLSATMGVPVSLGSVHLGLLEGRASIRKLAVGSPEGFHHDFLDLKHLVFDISPMSLLKQRLMGSAVVAVELEEVSINTLHVFIEQTSEYAPSNAKIIVDHLNALAPKAATQVDAEDGTAEALHALTTRIKADKIDFSDIGIGYCKQPDCGKYGPATYVVKEILITDIGKRGNGVFLYQLAEVVVRTVLVAVLKSAPDNMRQNLLRAIGSGVGNQLDNLDFGSLNFDLGDGGGLQTVGEMTGWLSGEFASLPMKATNAAVALNTKALELENDIRNSAIADQAKMGLEAAKIGTDLVGMGVKANTAFTNMGVKANTEVLKAETKANNFFNKVRDGFTSGFTSGLSR